MIRYGAIGVQQENTKDFIWDGVYSDKFYLPDLGNSFWNYIQSLKNKDILEFYKTLSNYGKWESFLTDGYCPYCGQINVGAPYKINITLKEKLSQGIITPDKECKYHSHGQQSFTIHSNRDGCELWVDWAIVLRPETFEIEILKTVIDGIDNGIATYKYFNVGLSSLFRDTPDWDYLENKGKQISKYHYKKHINNVKILK